MKKPKKTVRPLVEFKERGKIVETTSDTHSVGVKLDNGVKVGFSFNNGYIHIHFSGTELPIQLEHYPDVKLSNCFNLEYKPRCVS